jgi:UDP-N-acetylglucosamine acyltransferase
VSPRAQLGTGVNIGPYSIIGDHVVIGADTDIGAHVVIEGHTQVGERNKITGFSSIGTPPQDIGYRGEDTRLLIGNDNIIREYVTINRATTKERWETVMGDHNYIMAYAHIAHDNHLGNHVIMANVATLAGHVHVGDHTFLGGFAVVHQFVRIGAYAYVGGRSAVAQDIPPFMLVSGAEKARLYGINQKGLGRMGFSEESISGLKKAYRTIWRENRRLQEAIEKARQEIEPFPELEMLLGFLDGSKRGILR